LVWTALPPPTSNCKIIQRAQENMGNADTENLLIGPLTCPKCSGNMKIIIVIMEH
jgi:hypothetical protein